MKINCPIFSLRYHNIWYGIHQAMVVMVHKWINWVNATHNWHIDKWLKIKQLNGSGWQCYTPF